MRLVHASANQTKGIKAQNQQNRTNGSHPQGVQASQKTARRPVVGIMGMLFPRKTLRGQQQYTITYVAYNFYAHLGGRQSVTVTALAGWWPQMTRKFRLPAVALSMKASSQSWSTYCSRTTAGNLQYLAHRRGFPSKYNEYKKHECLSYYLSSQFLYFSHHETH